MTTYTTKIAKNGATLYYSTETGKRIAKETALDNEHNYIVTNGTIEERYALAKEVVEYSAGGNWYVNCEYTAKVPGKDGGWKPVAKKGWHRASEHVGNFIVDFLGTFNLTTDEFKNQAVAEATTVEEKTERAERHAAYIARVEAERANKVAEYTLVAGNEEDAIRAEYEAAFFADDEDDEPATAEETAEVEITEVKTASEMKANYAASQKVVSMHFTAKGNVAWQCIYQYGLHDREIGFQRISQKEAAERLTEFGLTPEQVIAVEKAKETASEEVSEICRRENRRYSEQDVYGKALSMVFGEDKTATVEENRFMVTAYYSCTDAQGRNWNGMDEGQCATAQAAAEWFINFAKEHPGYIIKSTSDTCIHGKVMSSIYDRKTRKEYSLTDADIAALKPADAEGMRTVTVADDTVKFFNGNFYSVFSAKYRAAIVHRLDGIISYRLCNSEGENNSEHEVSYDNFISTLAERGAWYIAFAEAQANSGVVTPLTRQDRERELLALVNMRDLAADEDKRAAINESINQLRRELINETMNNAGETTAPDDKPEPESPVPAETVIETKITSNNKIVVKLNGKRVSADEAKNAILGHDYQINPVKIIDELGEVFIGGTDSDNTVYVFKWERCLEQVFEIPFGTNPIQLIARRDLADYRKTPAPDKPEPAIEWPKLDSPSTDDFAAKLAALKTKQAGAKAKLDEKTAAREQAQKAVEDARNAEEMAYAEWRAADDEFKRLLNGKAKELTDTLWELPLAKIKIKSTIGKEFTCSCEWAVSTINNNYQICDGWDFCGEYDTPQQVVDVITALSDAIKRGETQFSFPTVEDLTPPEPELTDREKFLMASKVVTTEPGRHLGEDRFATKWVTLCPYKTISKATAGNILATFGLTSDAYLAEKAKWVADEIKRGSRQFAIDCQAEFLRDKTARDSKASVEPLPVFIPAEDREVDDELIDPPAIDKAHIEGSVTVKTISEACATINASAPEGWEVSYDTESKSFPVEFNGKLITTLDSLALTKILPPDKFFDQFRPLVGNDYTRRQQFLDDRHRELKQLTEMRKALIERGGQSKILDGLINQIKRDILDDELYGNDKPPEPPPTVEFDEHGNITAIWF